MVIKNINLETVCGITSVLPENDKPEIAFAGKSNVGKSSLINALMNRKSYARISATPGKTQTINFYTINEEMYLVDLPGYGYAKVSEQEKIQWGKLIERYLHTSKQLKAVFLLIDIRHDPSANDKMMYQWILDQGYQPIIIATKLDKIKRSQVQKHIKMLRQNISDMEMTRGQRMTNKRPYWQVAVSLLFSIAATVGFILIGWKLLGFLMPFVVGWIIASIATPVVNWLEKRLKIRKKLGSALIIIGVLALMGTLGYFAVSWLVSEVSSLIKDFPEMYVQLEKGLHQIGISMSGIFSKLPDGIQNGWTTTVANLDDTMGNLMSKISEPTVSAAGNIAKRVPSYLVSTIVAVMSSYFFISEREEVVTWVKQIAPKSVTERMIMVIDNLKYAVGGYFKAQFKIMGIVFLILAVGLGFLRVHYFVLSAFLIAFLDFLPFFGTGTAMIPWAIYAVFMGDYKRAIMLVVIYAITQIVRQLIQPKLVGDSVGLNPLVTLLLIYIGYRIGGVIWMILAVPVGMVIINMCQAGAFDYIFDDMKTLIVGILKLRDEE